MSSKFYITTAIDYPNGQPHMGHAYEKIITDVYARWYRRLGKEVFFLTGTDENGQKLVKAAELAGEKTQVYVDSQVEFFRALCKKLLITNDDFIRTTESRHHKTSQDFWKSLEAKGDIYFGSYEGLYCLACEAFYTELQSEKGLCPTHQTSLEKVKEEGYFFKLSAYSDWVCQYLESHPEVIRPESARKEMLNRLKKEPIRDLSISRPNQGWGIPVPGNDQFVLYTWFDALINYYTATQSPGRKSFWPASIHVIGKDIVWFHTVIWLSMLKSADLPLPEQIFVHGMVLGEDGRKMSKSLGNGVDPQWVLEKFPVDSFRYYLLRAIPSGMDGAFVRVDLQARHNNELANDYGNLLMRVTKLVMKKWGADLSTKGFKRDLAVEELEEKMKKEMNHREHHRALDHLWEGVRLTNEYLNKREPWRKEGSDPDFQSCMVNALYGLHVLGTLIEPFLPTIGAKTLEYLGTVGQGLSFEGLNFKLISPEPLFPKIEQL